MTKRSRTKKFFILCIVGLAIFGLYTLYERLKNNDTVIHMREKAGQIEKVLTE